MRSAGCLRAFCVGAILGVYLTLCEQCSSADLVKQYAEKWCRREVTINSDEIRADEVCAEITQQTCIPVRVCGRDRNGKWCDAGAVKIAAHWSKQSFWEAVSSLAESLGGDVGEADTVFITQRTAGSHIKLIPFDWGIVRVGLFDSLQETQVKRSAGAEVRLFSVHSSEFLPPSSIKLEANCPKAGRQLPSLACGTDVKGADYFFELPRDCVSERTRLRVRSDLSCVHDRRYLIAKVMTGTKAVMGDVALGVTNASRQDGILHVNFVVESNARGAQVTAGKLSMLQLLDARIVTASGGLAHTKYSRLGTDGTGELKVEQRDGGELYLIVLYATLAREHLILDVGPW